MIDKTMWAAVLTGFGEPLDIREMPTPEPGPGELLIRLETCGVCHSDLDMRTGETAPDDPSFPIILGHEGVGRVVAHGPGTGMIAEGTRVGLPWMHDTCGHCRQCLSGQESFCAEHRGHGFNVNGGFAQYAVVKEAYAAVIPDGLESLAAAPLLCAGVTAYGALLKADLRPGRTCAIFGCGGLGQYAIQLAKAAGATVIAIDPDAGKLTTARSLGADHGVVAGDTAAEAIRDLGGADACLNFAPTTATWQTMTGAVNPMGRIVAVAQVAEPVPLSQVWLEFTGVTIAGTSVGTRQELRDLLDLGAALDLKIPLEAIALNQADAALDRLAAGRVEGRLVIDFSAA